MKQPLTINNNKQRAAMTAGLSLKKEMGDEFTRVPVTMDFGGGKSYATQMPKMQMPESECGLVGHQSRNGNGDVLPLRIRPAAHRAKAEAFWKNLADRRADKANCARCGKPNDNGFRQCEKCRSYQKKYNARKRLKLDTINDVTKAIIQMRREMDRMQVRFKLWQKAAHYRRDLRYRTNTMRKKYHKPVSHAEAMDYLAETNHAYENADTQAG